MLIAAVTLLIILTVILLFSSKRLSPIPYFPSQKVDLPLIIKSLRLENNQTVIDLGAGDGIVIFEAAKKAYKEKLNTKFLAVEINPILIFILYMRRLFHPNRKNIKIIYGNMFFMNFKDFINFKNSITFYLYISPWFMEKTLMNIKRQLKKFKIVSYMYYISSLKKKESVVYAKNRIFVYN